MTARPELRGPGARVLRLIGYRSVPEVMAELALRGRRPSHLEREQDLVARSTFHRHVPELIELGAISRHVAPGPPREVLYRLGENGAELCDLIDRWTVLSPPASGASGGGGADRRAPIGLLEAWAAGVVSALLDGPLTLPEVEVIVRPHIPGLTGHQVRRLLENNERAGFLSGDGGRYSLTEVGRHAIGRLAEGARFESLHVPAPIPITVWDVVVALRAHLPLLELPTETEGLTEFIVRAGEAEGSAWAIAWAEIRGGRVSASGTGRAPRAAAGWTQGTIAGWMAAVMDHRAGGLRAGGERRLGRQVVEGLHRLFYARRGRAVGQGGSPRQ